MREFQRKDLNIPQRLTLDHVPAKALGGKDSDTVFICGECNHNRASKLDAAAKEATDLWALSSSIPGSSTEIKLALGDGLELPAEMSIDSQGHLVISRNPKQIDPGSRVAEQERNTIHTWLQRPDRRITAQIRLRTRPVQHASLAYLRYAYLIFFRWFGYAGIVLSNLAPVRDQLLNPDDKFLQGTWDLEHTELRQLPPGVYVIREPKEWRAFLVIYHLRIHGQRKQKSIILPGFGNESSDIGWKPISHTGSSSIVNLEVISLPKTLDLYWDNPEWCWHVFLQCFADELPEAIRWPPRVEITAL